MPKLEKKNNVKLTTFLLIMSFLMAFAAEGYFRYGFIFISFYSLITSVLLLLASFGIIFKDYFVEVK